MLRCLVGVTAQPVARTAHLTASDQPPDATAEGAAVRDFDAVYAASWASIARFAHLVVGSREVGEELAQDAFLGLLRHFYRVDAPVAYLRRSVVNSASSHRGRAARERVTAAAVP